MTRVGGRYYFLEVLRLILSDFCFRMTTSQGKFVKSKLIFTLSFIIR